MNYSNMSSPSDNDIISARREDVIQSYHSARAQNYRRFLEGDDKATAEYIFPNQKEDAHNIVTLFYKHNRYVISIQKKTKVGADGLMIEIATLMTTHVNNQFVVNPANVRIITGMSNAKWEEEMINKAPTCFKGVIFHHGKLQKSDLTNLRNALIIIDEIDTGNKSEQVLHTTLKEAGVLDVDYMKEHNIRFVFISATMIKELYDLYRWGDLHEMYKMTIPHEYIGHKDFLDRGIIKEFYPINTRDAAEDWIQEDILDYYPNEFRVHIIRVTVKTVNLVQDACIRKGLIFKNHTSDDRLTPADEKELFIDPLMQHVVVAVKGLLRRADLIPNRWKLRIGATHELYTKKVDNNVQVQGLPGRISGYWRSILDAGHKTGPHRTSIKAIQEYEKVYDNPFGKNTYQSAGFKKRTGKVSADSTMLSAKHIQNLEAVELPVVKEDVVDIKNYRIYSDMHTAREVCTTLYQKFTKIKENEEGFAITSHHGESTVMSLHDAVKLVPKCYGLEEKRGRRLYLPCYVDKKDNTTIRFVVIIHPGLDESKILECDAKFTSLRL